MSDIASRIKPAFLTTDGKAFTEKRLALAHQSTLDFGARIRALVDKFSDAAGGKYAAEKLAACEAFAQYLIDKKMLDISPPKKAPKAPPAMAAESGTAK
jgi:site-specific recombinase XerC